MSLPNGAIGPSGGQAIKRIYSVHLDCGDSEETLRRNQTFGHGVRCLRLGVVLWDADVAGGQLIIGYRRGAHDRDFIRVLPRQGMSLGGDGLVPNFVDYVDTTAVAESVAAWTSPSGVRAFLTRILSGHAGREHRVTTRYIHREKVYAMRSFVPYLNHCCFFPGMRPFPHPSFVGYFDAKSYVLVGLEGNGWGMILKREIVEPASRMPD